ncbi:MAG: carbohydrate binding family 9 domain-containing protein [Gemmatimonadetes bacterium]|nr:carbohydrate binding family 9 domain-containing protein [Gemmatimonadota bacterium]
MTPVAAVLAAVLAHQASGSGPDSAGSGNPAAPSAMTAAAIRAQLPPVIDGKDDDEIWRLAPAITGFREFTPVEDKDPRFATEAKVAYDARNFYVFIRAFDPHPDSILTLLARRDVRTDSDHLKIIIDSYHDRRTGYEFAVNPAGVRRDYAIYNDWEEDQAWDGVWEAATQVDSLGWTAEFRIPLSQLRYAPGQSNTFGFGIWRDIQRHTERVSWPLYRPSQAGLASQLGQVTGLEGLATPSRLELAPYAVAKNVSLPAATGYERDQQWTAGADLKYGLTSNLTVDATVNPDFGQVEADPSVLNLTAFETFFQERRPFFVAGSGIFSFNVNCSQVNCNGEGLFYSRRIGRSPQLGGAYGDARSPTATTILGAAKLTGRLPNGLTLGFLDAVTRREEGTQDRTIEPTTNYAAARAQRDFRRGETGVGVMLTAVNRSVDQWTEDVLRRSAVVGAMDFRHRFARGRYQLSGSIDISRVAGTARAIAATQRSAVHFYQRPDDDLRYDSTRTSLTGDAEEIYFSKLGGGLIRFETSYQRRSPGFEVNDMGFLLRADQQSWNNWLGLQFTRPAWIYRRAFWNFNWWQYWTAGGLALERAANTNVHAQLNSRWWVHWGGTLGQLGTTFCDRCARGGPAIRLDRSVSMWGGVEGDDRPILQPSLWMNYWRGDGGRSEFVNASPYVRMRVSSRFNASVGLSLSRNRDDSQWFGNSTDSAGTTHYTFAHLEQKTASLSWRMDYTLTTNLSFQLYASPFVSKGQYSNVRELANPRAASYTARFQPYGAPGNAGGFNFKQFRSNLVLRWEYRPGSTLFVVWGQARQAFDPAMGAESFTGDFRDLFDAHPNNSFLIKASYWLNW